MMTDEKIETVTRAVDHDSLSVIELNDWSELEGIAADWERLLSENPALGLFSTPEWLGSWWHAFGAGKELVALVFTDANRAVVGLSPMYRERVESPLVARVNLLRLVGDGSGDSDDMDFIVRPGYEGAVVRAFLKWFRNRKWDLCHLNALSPRSVVASLLLRDLRNNSWDLATHEHPCVTVPLPGTWELYLKQLSSKERGKIGNRTRRLETRHQLRFYKCQAAEELPQCLDTLFLLHQKRWEKLDESGSFSLPRRRQFYDEMARLRFTSFG